MSKESFYELVEQGRKGKNIGMSTGLKKLDSCMDGYLSENTYLIGGASGVSKSTFYLHSFIYNPLKQYLNDPEYSNRDPYWILFNLEMTVEQIYAKLVSMYIWDRFKIELPFKEMFSRGKDCILSDEHYEILKECNNFLDILDQRIIFHQGTLNAEKYRKEVLNDLKHFGTFVDDYYYPNNPDQIIGVCIDHMSLIRASNGRSKKEEMDLVSSQSVQIRNRCKIVSIINIMQFNRDASNQERLKQNLTDPSSSDFKDSGAIYEDSTVVLALYSPVKHKLSTYRKYNIKELQQKYIGCFLLKSRFGTSDIMDSLAFYGDSSIYKELPKADSICDYSIYKTPNWN